MLHTWLECRIRGSNWGFCPHILTFHLIYQSVCIFIHPMISFLINFNRQVQHLHGACPQTSGCLLHQLWSGSLRCVNQGTVRTSLVGSQPNVWFADSDRDELCFEGWGGFHFRRGTPRSARPQLLCWWVETQTGWRRGRTRLTDLLWQVKTSDAHVITVWG